MFENENLRERTRLSCSLSVENSRRAIAELPMTRQAREKILDSTIDPKQLIAKLRKGLEFHKRFSTASLPPRVYQMISLLVRVYLALKAAGDIEGTQKRKSRST